MNRRLNRFATAFAALAALCLALPATAQVKTRDHRKRHADRPTERVKARRGKPKKGVPPIAVTRWGPQSGPAGTEVVIEGRGFGRKVLLLVGGKRVRPHRMNDSTLAFRVPRRAGDGTIVLRHPQMADDLVVGRFDVIAPPLVRSVSPASGVAGTRVEIRGVGFRPGDQVLMNGRAIAVESLAPTRIVAVIPQGATTDYLVVSRPNGPQARSRRPFRVVQPAPVIEALSPVRGAAGATVRIQGKHFTGKDRVFYGRWPMQVTGSAPTWIDAVIPQRARTDEYIVVRTPWGRARSREPFHLDMPPAIARFAPTYGPVGTRVTIDGQNFAAGDQVLLAGTPVPIVQLRPTQIVIEIPARARSGKLTLLRGNLRVHARGTFDVVAVPSVAEFSPAGGPVGTRVTISGTGFTPDVEVFYGRRRLRVLQRSDTSLVVEIPRGARDDVFRVRTRGGEASSGAPFRVYTYSEVVRVRPLHGPPGTRVTILGRNFARTDRFFIGDVELPVEQWSPRKVVVRIAEGAVSGRLAWETHDRRMESRFAFTVLQPPTIARITPSSGPPGTRITIEGDRFTNDTQVLFGNRSIPVVERALPKRLVAEIPANARGTADVWVINGGGRARAGQRFQVVVPASISGFSPESGRPGVEVTLSGENFTRATRVRLGPRWLDIVRWTPRSLTVRIPGDAPAGTDYLWIVDGATEARSAKPFQVLGTPEITRVAPARARPRQRVVVHGRNFSPSARVYFGRYECRVLRVDPRGTSIEFALADDATGRGYIWVEDGGRRLQSPNQLEVIGSANDRRKRRR